MPKTLRRDECPVAPRDKIVDAEQVYHRKIQTFPKLGDFQDRLRQWLEVESRLPKKQRRTAQRLFEGLQAEGYGGAYDSV